MEEVKETTIEAVEKLKTKVDQNFMEIVCKTIYDFPEDFINVINKNTWKPLWQIQYLNEDFSKKGYAMFFRSYYIIKKLNDKKKWFSNEDLEKLEDLLRSTDEHTVNMGCSIIKQTVLKKYKIKPHKQEQKLYYSI